MLLLKRNQFHSFLAFVLANDEDQIRSVFNIPVSVCVDKVLFKRYRRFRGGDHLREINNSKHFYLLFLQMGGSRGTGFWSHRNETVDSSAKGFQYTTEILFYY